jgi:hypothetical membrane protein
MEQDNNSLQESHRTAVSTRALVIVLLLLWLLSARHFGEPFLFFEHPVSALGALKTPSGAPNGAGAALFILSMLVTSVWMALLTRSCLTSPGTFSRIFAFLHALGALGALLAGVPTDVCKPVHSIGSGMLVFSHLALTCIRIYLHRREYHPAAFILRLALLLVPVLIYAWCWFTWQEEVVQLAQKAAFAALFFFEYTSVGEQTIEVRLSLIKT